METCIICFEDDNELINPKNCSCKVFLHEECLKKCETTGLLCPICRKQKKTLTIITNEFNNFELNPIQMNYHATGPYQYVQKLIFYTLLLLLVIIPLISFITICYYLFKYNYSHGSYAIFPTLYLILICVLRR